jgi:hypothetical protein
MDFVPCQTRVIIPLREKDDHFIKIQELIEAKEKMLFEKQKKLQIISKENDFLEVIKDDYSNVYNYVVQQKTDQIKALYALDEYLKQLNLDDKVTKYNLEDSKEEQKKILNEVELIKRKLDSIISDTKNVSSYNKIHYK